MSPVCPGGTCPVGAGAGSPTLLSPSSAGAARALVVPGNSRSPGGCDVHGFQNVGPIPLVSDERRGEERREDERKGDERRGEDNFNGVGQQTAADI